MIKYIVRPFMRVEWDRANIAFPVLRIRFFKLLICERRWNALGSFWQPDWWDTLWKRLQK